MRPTTIGFLASTGFVLLMPCLTTWLCLLVVAVVNVAAGLLRVTDLVADDE